MKDVPFLNQDKPLLPILAGILIAFLFGFSFLFSKQSLNTMAPMELLAHRFTLASLLLILLIAVKFIQIRWNWHLLFDLLPLAVFQPLLYFLGETYGIKYTSASESGIIISLTPVAVTLLEVIFLKERVKLQQWFLIMMTVLGVVLIVLAGSAHVFQRHLWGILALLIAVIAASVFNILSRKSSRFYTPIEITVVRMVTAAVFFNCLRLVTMSPTEHYFGAFLQRDSLFGLLYLGLACSVGAFFLMNYMLNKMPAFQVATFVNLTTVISVMAGVIFRKESFGGYHIIGTILILGGVGGLNLTVYKRPNKLKIK
ncbi:MAG TPA: EamA family transporter [Firmicutes bacterium]|jgi:drug/metabolite transporter (DMT)-like permease|nr:EamA family transporter [Bacillota bacterium]